MSLKTLDSHWVDATSCLPLPSSLREVVSQPSHAGSSMCAQAPLIYSFF